MTSYSFLTKRKSKFVDYRGNAKTQSVDSTPKNDDGTTKKNIVYIIIKV